MDSSSVKRLIGTHNSFSYLPVKQWYLKPFAFVARCQTRNIISQIKYYDCIDVRLSMDVHYYWQFSHGVIDYKSANVIDVLNATFKKINKPFYVRLILEKITDEHDRNYEIMMFKHVCEQLERKYPNITFFGGNYKKDWTKIYNFKTVLDEEVSQYISSMADDVKWYEKFCPSLYAKRMNKVNLKKYNNHINLFDFI